MSNAKGDKSPGSPEQAKIGAYTRFGGLTPGWYTIGMRRPDGFEGPLPRQVTTFAGLDWPFECCDENPTQSGDTLHFNQTRRGKRIWLGEEEIEAIQAAVDRKVFRPRNAKKGTWTIVLKTARGYRRMKYDRPVEEFLYARHDEEPRDVLDARPEPAGAMSLV